jgi:hypothetical protein
VTAYEAASLGAQWVGSIAAALAVLVAAVFGYLTYANNKRSRDNQERATLAAVTQPDGGHRVGILPTSRDRADFRIRHGAGENWLLVNEGPGTVWGVRIEGLTTLDEQRLTVSSPELSDLGPGQAKEFVLVSRRTRSGPANVVVFGRLDSAGPELRQVLQVPAP